jgi:hypothetical protein
MTNDLHQMITDLTLLELISSAENEAITPLLMGASFKDFHARGLDYVCLKRTPEHTVKVYILDGDSAQLPEVVNPHDHRYSFATNVLHGTLIDFRYRKVDEGGMVYNAFDYRTPLNGGDGFTFRGEERLAADGSIILVKGFCLETRADHLHTIRTMADQTVLVLEQFAAELPVGEPTSCWVHRGAPAPDTSGLYSKFTEGEFMDKLAFIRNTILKKFA